MGVADIAITVDCDPTKGLVPGQVISGRIICNTGQPKDFEYLTLTFSGFAHVHWSESRTRYSGSGKNRTSTTYYVYFTSHQDYFEFSTLLDGGDRGSHELPAGGKTYPFQVVFPGNIPGLPSSFEGSVAHVRYQLFAHLKRGLFKSDSKIEQRFAYYAPYDLNALPDTQFIRGPARLQNEKFLGCCCCKSGPISMQIDIPKQGFVPGEYLNYRCHFVNSSKSAIQHVIIQLHAMAEYRAEGHSRHDSLVLATVTSKPLEPGVDVHWEGVMLIPPCSPTNLGGNCKNISVNYAIEFIMVPDRTCSTNLIVQTPIMIGTVPLLG